MKPWNFRLGTTSYILPADILPNVQYLAGRVDDVELVLFELDDGPNNLPDDAQRNELARLAIRHNLTYTVHLPLDLRLGIEGGEQHISLVKARRVIEATRALQPWAYVLHLDGREELQQPGAAAREKWLDQATRALQIAGAWAGDPSLLAVENLDNYPPGFWDEIFTRTPVSRCIDIGHLWKDGHDPLPFLQRNLRRARVLHIHGTCGRDHRSLRHVPPDELRRVMGFVVDGGFSGVLTIEVFNQGDLDSSIQALSSALQGSGREAAWEGN